MYFILYLFEAFILIVCVSAIKSSLFLGKGLKSPSNSVINKCNYEILQEKTDL